LKSFHFTALFCICVGRRVLRVEVRRSTFVTAVICLAM